MWFFRKRAKKGQNIWNFGPKCTKFKNILKKGSLICATETAERDGGLLEKEDLKSPKSLQNKTNLINNLDKDCLKQICHWSVILVILVNTFCVSQTF